MFTKFTKDEVLTVQRRLLALATGHRLMCEDWDPEMYLHISQGVVCTDEGGSVQGGTLLNPTNERWRIHSFPEEIYSKTPPVYRWWEDEYQSDDGMFRGTAKVLADSADK